MVSFYNMNDVDKLSFLNQLRSSGKNILFDFFCIYSLYRLKTLSKHDKPISVGNEYIQVKSNINKHLGIEESEQDNISLDKLSKMSLKERMDYKSKTTEINSLHNIYEDIQVYLREKSTSSKGVDKIYNEIVIDEVNETIANSILNNNDIYTGLIIVRRDRLDSLYDKLNEHIKLI
jgi:hypothetical protein